jgi:large subunit ribosomal protein L25
VAHLTDRGEIMSDKLTLTAEARTEFGKGFARRARMAGKIPAVLYGHGSDPLHVVLPGHETMLALKHSNALFTIKFGDDTHLAVAKDVQRNAVKRTIDHVDLLIVKKGEKITVDVAVHVVGESYPGTIHVLENNTLQILAEATNLPEGIEVSIEGLEDGDKIFARDVKLVAGSELMTDPDSLVVAISTPRASAEDDAADAAVAADASAQSAASAEAAEAAEEADSE